MPRLHWLPISPYVKSMLPSLFASGDNARAWSVRRAAAYGAALGAFASLFKTLGPMHEPASVSMRTVEIVGVTVAFALLCAGAAALRNFIVRRFIWSG